MAVQGNWKRSLNDPSIGLTKLTLSFLSSSLHFDASRLFSKILEIRYLAENQNAKKAGISDKDVTFVPFIAAHK